MNPAIPQLLIMDDDEEMRQLVSSQIKSSDYGLMEAHDYGAALQTLKDPQVCLLIANSKIPEISFGDFMRRVRTLRPAQDLAVLVLMNPKQNLDTDAFIKAGADEVLMRPFDRPELVAKIRALLKKNHPDLDQSSKKTGKLCFNDLMLDPHSFDVFSKGERIKLTPNEIKLLHAFLERQGETLSRDRLIELVQGEGVAVIDRAVDTHIFSLRKKLGVHGDAIETVRGEGYRMGAQNKVTVQSIF